MILGFLTRKWLKDATPFMAEDLAVGLLWGACGVWNWDDGFSAFTIGFVLLAPVLVVTAGVLYLKISRYFLIAAAVHLLAALQGLIALVYLMTTRGGHAADSHALGWLAFFGLYFLYAAVHAFWMDRGRPEANRTAISDGLDPKPVKKPANEADDLAVKPGWDQGGKPSKRSK